MDSTSLRPGFKVTIKITQQAAREQQNGNESATGYQSEIFDMKKNGILVLNVPTLHMKLVTLPTNLRYDFMFTTDKGFYLAHGNILNRYRKGNFFLMDVQLTSPLEKFQRREFFRLECSLKATCIALGDKDFDVRQIGDVEDYLMDNIDAGYSVASGYILNISGGGALFITDYNLSDIAYVIMRIVLHEQDAPNETTDIIARILDQKKNEDNGRYYYRMRFIFRNSKLREKIVQYIFEEQRLLRRKERGM